jgi:hypothetical protein
MKKIIKNLMNRPRVLTSVSKLTVRLNPLGLEGDSAVVDESELSPEILKAEKKGDIRISDEKPAVVPVDTPADVYVPVKETKKK